MEIYLLKFSGCLLVFWLVYVLFLERQNRHHFKRFYLLGALALALAIPTLTITEYVEPIVTHLETAPVFMPTESFVEMPIEDTPFFDLETTLWLIYGLGALLFSIRFVINLTKMNQRISKNENITNQSFIYVLLKENLIPHSFFKYIFYNKTRYESNTIPKEVKLHEETHAKQLHSIDILILEILQILFWFHPLIYILKHHIKLNHEFLADQAVLEQGADTKTYQNILLQFSSNTQEYSLSSAINYSSIKKRFTVMKTQTSKTKIWLSSLLLLPIIAILFYSFAERVEVEKPTNRTSPFLVTVEKNGNAIELRCKDGCKWSHLILEPSSEPYIINNYGFSEGKTIDTDKFTFSIQPSENGVNLNGLKGTAWKDLSFSLNKNKEQAIDKFGMTTINAEELVEITKDRNIEIKAINNKLTIDGILYSIDNYANELNKITQDWSEEDFKSTIPELEIKNCSQEFIDKLDAEFRKSNYFLINIQGSKPYAKGNDWQKIEEISDQQKATSKQVAEYNTLAKKYNAQPKDQRVVKLKDLKTLESIYRLMSEEQKKNAESFPECPHPPAKPNKSKSKGGPSISINEMAGTHQNTIKPVEILIKKDNSIILNDRPIKHTNFVDAVTKINQQLTIEERRKYVSASIIIEQNKSLDFAQKIQRELANADIWSSSIGYMENEKKTGLQTKHVSPNAGLTIEEAEIQRKKALKETQNYKQPKNSPSAIEMNTTKVVEDAQSKQGPIKINGNTYYFSKVNGKTTYYNRFGTEVKKADLPQPQTEESTLDFVIRMSKANAKFFNEGKSVSSDKAIDLLKKNPKLNINAQKTDTKQPLIYISKKPMLIGVKGKVGKVTEGTQKQKSILPIVNGKILKTGNISMPLSEIKKIILTLPNSGITAFKIKIPGVRTEFIKGNSITSETIKNLNSANTGDYITIFDIKDNKGSKVSPVTIEIVD